MKNKQKENTNIQQPQISGKFISLGPGKLPEQVEVVGASTERRRFI